MADALSAAEVCELRAQSQWLLGDSSVSAPAVVLQHLVAAQAQVHSASLLSLRARANRLTVEAIEKALWVERAVVRGWLLRGTLHIVAAEDYRWIAALLGPLFDRPSKRRADLGLDPETMERGLAAVRKVLADNGPSTRSEIVEAINHLGMSVERKTQAPAHLLLHCGLTGLVCEGAPKGKETTWVLTSDWLTAHETPPKEPWAELARRFLAAYGPACPEDLAAWSGVSLGQARKAFDAISGHISEIATVSGPMWTLDRPQPDTQNRDPSARLLPEFDTYLFGYRSRDLAYSKPLQRTLQRGGGWVHRSVVVDGRGVAAWSMERTGSAARIQIQRYEELSESAELAIADEAARVGDFLGTKVTVATDLMPGI